MPEKLRLAVTSTLPKVSLTAGALSSPELSSGGATSLGFAISLDAPATETQSVHWQVVGSGVNPAAGSDFTGGVLPSGTVSFVPGQTSGLIPVWVAQDGLVEPDESFEVFLSNPSAGLVLGASTFAAATILNDDLPRVAIAAIDTAKAEGASGTTPFAFTVYLDAAAASTLSVWWQTMGSGASSATFADFTGGVEPSGTVTFAPGETSKTISVNVASDTRIEPDEGFQVILLAPAPGLASGSAIRASATILNDDVPKVGLRLSTPARAEGGSGSTAFTFAVTLDAPSHTAQSVQWQVAGTGANPAVASDFAGGALPSGVLVFAPGEVGKTVTVNVAGDSIVEPSEAFRVLLSDPSPGLLLGSAVTAGFTHQLRRLLIDDGAGRFPFGATGDERHDRGFGGVLHGA